MGNICCPHGREKDIEQSPTKTQSDPITTKNTFYTRPYTPPYFWDVVSSESDESTRSLRGWNSE